jgi:hypothetical protein
VTDRPDLRRPVPRRDGAPRWVSGR